MLQNIGTTEIIIVALVILVLFGGRKIPELVHGMAEAVREFRKASKDNN
jgi:sec-independent protein translocase protein TatA